MVQGKFIAFADSIHVDKGESGFPISHYI